MPSHHNQGEFGDEPVGSLQRRQPNGETPRLRQTPPAPEKTATGGPDAPPSETEMSLSTSRQRDARDISREPSSAFESLDTDPTAGTPPTSPEPERDPRATITADSEDLGTAASVVSALSGLFGVI